MLYNHLYNPAQETVLEGPYSQFQLLGQGLNTLRTIEEEAAILGTLDRLPWPTGQEPSHLDVVTSKLPHYDVSLEEDPLRRIVVARDELQTLCCGVRLAAIHARRARGLFGASADPAADRLAKQAGAYSKLYGELAPSIAD